MPKVPQYQVRRSTCNLAGGTTVYYPLGAGQGIAASTTEAVVQHTVRAPGLYTNLLMRVQANGSSSASALTSRVNGSDGAQSLSIGAGATGVFEDTSHGDALAAGALLNVKLVAGATNGPNFTVLGCLFAPAADTVVTHAAAAMTSPATASASAFTQYVGRIPAYATPETAAHQYKFKVTGLLRNLNVVVSANGRSTATTFGLQVNGSASAVTLSVGSGATGQFEDTSHSVLVVGGDLVSRYLTTGTGTGTIAHYAYNDCVSSFAAVPLVGWVNLAYAVTGTYYEGVQGGSGGIGNGFALADTDSQSNLGTLGVCSAYGVQVTVNTIVTSSTWRVRKNGANASGAISIGALSTGWFEDTSHSDLFLPADTVNYELTLTAAATSLSLGYISCVMQQARTASGFFAIL